MSRMENWVVLRTSGWMTLLIRRGLGSSCPSTAYSLGTSSPAQKGINGQLFLFLTPVVVVIVLVVVVIVVALEIVAAAGSSDSSGSGGSCVVL